MSSQNLFRAYQRKKKNQSIATFSLIIFALAGMILNEYGKFNTEIIQKYIVPAMILVLILFIVFSLQNWRCPRCRAYLGREMNPKFCKNCGVQLVEFID